MMGWWVVLSVGVCLCCADGGWLCGKGGSGASESTPLGI